MATGGQREKRGGQREREPHPRKVMLFGKNVSEFGI